MVYILGDGEFKLYCDGLRQGNELLELGDNELRALLYMVQRQEQVITSPSLLRVLDTKGQDTSNVSHVIGRLRRHLQDFNRRRPRFIQTVNTGGYRFIAPVKVRPSMSRINALHPFELKPTRHPRLFFGRRKLLSRLLRHWSRSLENVALVGPAKLGKTSILNHLQFIDTTPPSCWRSGQYAALPKLDISYIYVDFDNPEYRTRHGLINYLLEKLAPDAPRDCELTQFIQSVGQNRRHRTIVLLDNLSIALEQYRELDNQLWNAFRSISTSQSSNLSFLLTSDKDPYSVAQEQGITSSFLNTFGFYDKLEAFEEEESREFISSSPIPFSEPDIQWILEQSQGLPFPLQILCSQRLDFLYDSDESDPGWKDKGTEEIVRLKAITM